MGPRSRLAGDAGTWDDQNNASLDLLDAHNHTIGAGVRSRPAGSTSPPTDAERDVRADQREGARVHDAGQLHGQQVAVGQDQRRRAVLAQRERHRRQDDLGRDAQHLDRRRILGDYAAAAAAVYYDDSAQACTGSSRPRRRRTRGRGSSVATSTCTNTPRASRTACASQPDRPGGELHALTLPAALPGPRVSCRCRARGR